LGAFCARGDFFIGSQPVENDNHNGRLCHTKDMYNQCSRRQIERFSPGIYDSCSGCCHVRMRMQPLERQRSRVHGSSHVNPPLSCIGQMDTGVDYFSNTSLARRRRKVRRREVPVWFSVLNQDPCRGISTLFTRSHAGSFLLGTPCAVPLYPCHVHSTPTLVHQLHPSRV
jgi:hypothetical protein